MELFFANFLIQGLLLDAACAFVFLAARRLQKRYSAQWFCRVWLVLALLFLLPLRLLVPTAPAPLQLETPTALTAPLATRLGTEQNMPAAEPPELSHSLPGHESSDLTISQADGRANAALQDQTTAPSEKGSALPASGTSALPRWSALRLCGIIWLSGALLLLTWQLTGYFVWRRRALRCSLPADVAWQAAFDTAFAESRLTRQPRFLRSEAVNSPVVAGLLRPVVLVPGHTVPGTAGIFMLAHELTHLKRGDIALKALLAFVRAARWYDPFAWLLVKRAGRDIESACDEQMVAGRGPEYRADYCDALLHAVRLGHASALTSGFALSKRDMLARLARLWDTAPKRRGLGALAVMAGCACMLGGLVACGKAVPPVLTPAASSFAPFATATPSPAPGLSGRQKLWPAVYSVQFLPRFIPDTPDYSGFDLLVFPYYLTDLSVPEAPNDQIVLPALANDGGDFASNCSRHSHGYMVPGAGLWSVAVPSPDKPTALIICTSRDNAETWALNELDLSPYLEQCAEEYGWDQPNSHWETTLFQYQFVNEQTGFVVFSGEYLFPTPDKDGKTRYESPGSFVLRTLDGGQHWQTMTAHAPLSITDVTSRCNQVYFANENVGFSASHRTGDSEQFALLRTTDGGASWQPVDLSGVEATLPYDGRNGYHVCYIMGRDPQTNSPGSVLVGAYLNSSQTEPILLFSEDFGQSWSWKERLPGEFFPERNLRLTEPLAQPMNASAPSYISDPVTDQDVLSLLALRISQYEDFRSLPSLLMDVDAGPLGSKTDEQGQRQFDWYGVQHFYNEKQLKAWCEQMFSLRLCEETFYPALFELPNHIFQQVDGRFVMASYSLRLSWANYKENANNYSFSSTTGKLSAEDLAGLSPQIQRRSNSILVSIQPDNDIVTLEIQLVRQNGVWVLDQLKVSYSNEKENLPS